MKKAKDTFLDWCEFYLPMCLVGAGVGGVIGVIISIIYKLFQCIINPIMIDDTTDTARGNQKPVN